MVVFASMSAHFRLRADALAELPAYDCHLPDFFLGTLILILTSIRRSTKKSMFLLKI